MPSTLSNLLYHFVFSTKRRRPLIVEEYREELYRYIGGIIRAAGGSQLEIGGTSDHVHILAKLKTSESVAQVLNRVKSNFSRWVNEEKQPRERFAWQEGYGAFSVSESNVDSVRNYIRHQEEHHRARTFQEELMAMLERNRVEYDPRHLWD